MISEMPPHTSCADDSICVGTLLSNELRNPQTSSLMPHPELLPGGGMEHVPLERGL